MLTEHQIESRLLDDSQGFDQLYTGVKSLFSRMNHSPDTIGAKTLTALFYVIRSNRHLSQRQHYFLFKEAAEALIYIAMEGQPLWAKAIIEQLQTLLIESDGRRRRAVSEALGALPLNITGPDIHPQKRIPIKTVEFNDLLHYLNTPESASFFWHGRTLRFSTGNNTVGCIKFATSRKSISDIELEVRWLLHLKQLHHSLDEPFHIPTPLLIDDHSVFNIAGMPESVINGNGLPAEYPAIVFTTVASYYQYPNEGFGTCHTPEAIAAVFRKNARLLGHFTANGIIHTALIPLFHNRIQQRRRQDRGVYRWEQGGRLDRWLESCQYPNFAVSGLRDFEHLSPLIKPLKLHHYLGEHLLGFFLVLGSTFRNTAPHCVGWDDNNLPYDTTHLFDTDFFYETMQQIIHDYFEAVTGNRFDALDLIFSKNLILKLVREMGVDRHMEETLRIQDQRSMDNDYFLSLLRSRGIDESRIADFVKGEADILLTSGPHLGGFNQPISVPELIEFLFCFSSLCIADRYLYENGLKGRRN